MSDQTVAVLVPGRIHPRVLERLNQACEVVQVPAGPVTEIDPAVRERIRGVAISGALDNGWMESLPNLQIVSNFGVGAMVNASCARSGSSSEMAPNWVRNTRPVKVSRKCERCSLSITGPFTSERCSVTPESLSR